ncbi:MULTISPECIES: amidohydrolase family protein [unclassified Novosphingobium]|uniref:N-acyl-D-amino-acid deacylase family protein n=1 Tax=unclassified Novosphingobium TaxID=2644732 RepID=UPI0025F6C6E8|nr:MULTISPECIES: amidohydrolase family protein [unclassified Novosphingobium]HQV03743.1 amidohydrolase family protein [Novosphingobium sp.]
MAQYDLIIRGGTIHDGTGAPPLVGDVAVRDGRIAAVGVVDGEADEVIDAAGKIVTPGFVDVHTHFDGQVTWESRLAPSSGHGVTTVVMGNCGVGFAPCRPAERDTLVKLMEGIEDIPEVVMVEGLPWNWETFPEYLDALAQRRLDIDIAAQIPHSALRVYVMGERAARKEPPTAEDLAAMRALVAEGIRAGGFGVTTSRNVMHRTRAGDLAPSLFSDVDELCALAGGLDDAGAGVFQIIPAPAEPAEVEFPILRQIAEQSGRPISFTLLEVPGQAGEGWRYHLAELDRAAADGLKMTGQVAPRPVGMFFGLNLSLHLFSSHPSYKPIAHLPLGERVAIMRDPDFKARLLAEQPEDSNPTTLMLIAAFRATCPWGERPDYEPSREDRVEARAAAAGLSLEEFAYDALLADEGRAVFYLPAANYAEGNLKAVREMLGSPHTLMALADGGAHYGLICDASFPTYYLQRWVRDAAPDEAIDLADAIAELTGRAAALVGFADRGRVAVGMKADLNVIDLEGLTLHVPTIEYDLPAGGKRMHQRAEGFTATIVSGQVTYRDGAHTGALPGRLVRRQDAAMAA